MSEEQLMWFIDTHTKILSELTARVLQLEEKVKQLETTLEVVSS